LTENEATKTTRQEVRKFGLMFSALCFGACAYLIYLQNDSWVWLACGSGFFLVTGLVGYVILRPIYMGWMKFALALGWVSTRVLLGIFFFFIVTPVGLMMRLMGKDLLDKKLNHSATTHWKKRELVPFDPKRMERQF
jgi:hypothetical protein